MLVTSTRILCPCIFFDITFCELYPFFCLDHYWKLAMLLNWIMNSLIMFHTPQIRQLFYQKFTFCCCKGDKVVSFLTIACVGILPLMNHFKNWYCYTLYCGFMDIFVQNVNNNLSISCASTWMLYPSYAGVCNGWGCQTNYSTLLCIYKIISHILHNSYYLLKISHY